MKIDIQTPDGVCPADLYRPEGRAPWPAVLVLMDAPGIRPALQEMAERLAGNGYIVLLPDLFYRSGPYAPIDPKVVFLDPKLREAHMARFKDVTTADFMSDVGAYLDALAAQPDVKPGPVGVTGYCMGGRLALVAAGTFPSRIGAVASYHGGGLATDAPDSPHLLASQIEAKVYVAGAIEDAHFPDEQKHRLEAALTEAGVDHVVETYPAKHGWVPRDTPAYDAAEAEHHWRTLVALFDGALKA